MEVIALSRNCMFCGQKDVSREHVLPYWLTSEAARRGLTDWRVARGDLGEHRTIGLTQSVKQACTRCNTGWLSMIETDAKPFLTPMIFGDQRSIEISTAAQVALATWVYKTVLTSAFLWNERGIEKRYLNKFYETRTAPTGCTIWTGAYGGLKPPRFRLIGNVLAAGTPGEYNEHGILDWNKAQRTNVLSSILFLYHAIFAIQVTADYRVMVGDPLERFILHRIWPTGETISWPRNGRAFSSNTLEKFVRFSTAGRASAF